MSRLLWICLGGAVGTGARYLIAAWLPRLVGTTFPYATLLVNSAGSFLIAANGSSRSSTRWWPTAW